jgi:hypothetical protein
MLRHTLQIRWAGPAVALALVAAVVPARAAAAPAPARAAITAQPTPCVLEAEGFGQAMYEWYVAADAYINSLPGGTESEIIAAADQLDRATDNVVQTGGKLLLCLVMHLE